MCKGSPVPGLEKGRAGRMSHSSKRVTYWKMDADPTAFDTAEVGVKHTALDSAPIVAEKREDLLIYDTTRWQSGTSNQGHNFGDKLTEDERLQVIEFLKVLGTENVKPNPIGKEIVYPGAK